MKKYIGLFLLVLFLAFASGCTTQQAKTVTTTIPPVTTATATEVPSPASTPEQTSVSAQPTATQAPETPVPETSAPVTSVTTPVPAMKPSTSITTIHIRNNSFVPDTLVVLPGTGITWINDDPGVHVVKASGDSKGKFTSSEMVTGANFIYTFGEATGTFEFGDPSYPGMNGTIIVKKGETLYESGAKASP